MCVYVWDTCALAALCITLFRSQRVLELRQKFDPFSTSDRSSPSNLNLLPVYDHTIHLVHSELNCITHSIVYRNEIVTVNTLYWSYGHAMRVSLFAESCVTISRNITIKIDSISLVVLTSRLFELIKATWGKDKTSWEIQWSKYSAENQLEKNLWGILKKDIHL